MCVATPIFFAPEGRPEARLQIVRGTSLTRGRVYRPCNGRRQCTPRNTGKAALARHNQLGETAAPRTARSPTRPGGKPQGGRGGKAVTTRNPDRCQPEP